MNGIVRLKFYIAAIGRAQILASPFMLLGIVLFVVGYHKGALGRWDGLVALAIYTTVTIGLILMCEVIYRIRYHRGRSERT